jgi:DNA-binding response OmpR family regulator
VSDLKPKVLVLDEDLLALELYSRELGQDYQVVTSESVQETRQYLKSHSLDALIIEPAVNEDEGWTLLKEIRSTQNPPLVILCSVEDDRKAGLGQGAYAFLVKPVLPATLHSLLDQVLAKKSFQSARRPERGS